MLDLNINQNHRITIVTAFFDIGRGNIPKNQGYPGYLTRTTKTYFKYFSNLAKLNNEMVIFTSPDLKERILKLRKGKPTKIITIHLQDKFKHILAEIMRLKEYRIWMSLKKEFLSNKLRILNIGLILMY